MAGTIRPARRRIALALVLGLVGLAGPGHAAAAVAKPVFGVNMSFYNAQDELVTSAETRRLLAGWGVPFVRVPLRDRFPDNGPVVSDAQLLAALNAVKDIGATPVAVLRGPGHGRGIEELESVNRHLLDLVHQVFGDATAYLEFGNEPDLASNPSVSASDYTAAWNAVIPVLRRQFPAASYKFAGPVVSRIDASHMNYISTFVANVTDPPDALSWHEYVCQANNGDDWKTVCMGHIANWQKHVTMVRDVVTAKFGHMLDYLISEWNVDPVATTFYDDSAKITQWTSAAITQLRNLVPAPAAAMIYTATDHGNFALVRGTTTPTAQGAAFHDAMTPTPGDPPPGGGNQYYVSESGNDQNDGRSPRTAWRTLAKAAADADPGDRGATVHVANGTYRPVHVTKDGKPGAPVTYVADSPHQAKITTGDRTEYVVRVDGDYTRFAGFEITGRQASEGILIDADHTVVQGNYVHDVNVRSCADIGDHGGDGIGDDRSDIDNTIIGNLVTHIGPADAACDHVHGIYPSGAHDNIWNNITGDNAGSGIRFNHGTTGATIANNLSFHNRNHGISISGDDDSGKVTKGFVLTNNILCDNAMFGVNVFPSANDPGNEYGHNLFNNNKKGQFALKNDPWTPGHAAGEVTGDPKFVRYQPDGTGDYHLTPASPAVETGTTTGAPDVDYDGVKRSTPLEIGPYEFDTGR